MLSIFSNLRDLTFGAVALRMCLAVVCGGIIGLERTFRGRPAGFRTHMLICLGAAMTTLTSQFLLLKMGYHTDVSRLGAQVVAGIGFIGAGTIITTRHQRVKGLTTAAGLWTSAIVGLSLGAGFYEGSLAVTACVLFAELFLSKLEYLVLRKSPEINLYLRYDGSDAMEGVLDYLRKKHIKVLSLEITRPIKNEKHNATAILLLRLDKRIPRKVFLEQLLGLEGVSSADLLSS